MERNIYLLLLCWLSIFNCDGQENNFSVNSFVNGGFLGKARLPLKTSFYSQEAWQKNEYSFLYYRDSEYRNLTTFGIADELEINKVGSLILDSSISLTDFGKQLKKESGIGRNTLVLNISNVDFIIGFEFVSKSINSLDQISSTERILIQEKIFECIKVSGYMPSKVIIESFENDYNLQIYTRDLEGDSPILTSYNVKSRAEIYDACNYVNRLIENNEIYEARAKLSELESKYNNRGIEEFLQMSNKIERLSSISKINNRKEQYSILLMVEQIGSKVKVFDGMDIVKEFDNVNKEEFLSYLSQLSADGKKTIYLDDQSLLPSDRSKIFSSVSNLIISENKNIRLRTVPFDKMLFDLCFNGLLQNSTNKIANSSLSTMSFDVSFQSELYRVDVGLTIDDTIKEKSRTKAIKRFFKSMLNLSKSNEEYLNESILKSRKRIKKRLKHLNDSQIKNNIITEFGVNIVFTINKIEENTEG